MNTAAKGRRNEHRSRALLEAAGYSVVRAAASKGEWDLVGVSSTDIILLQVKSTSWPSASEMESLELFAAPPNARKLVHRWRDRVGVPDVREIP